MENQAKKALCMEEILALMNLGNAHNRLIELKCGTLPLFSQISKIEYDLELLIFCSAH